MVVRRGLLRNGAAASRPDCDVRVEKGGAPAAMRGRWKGVS